MKNNLLVILLIFGLSSCVSQKPKDVAVGPTQLSFPLDRYSRVSLGVSESEVRKALGEPSSLNVEKYDSSEFRTLEYNDVNGKALSFFALDSSDKVIGRSYWIYSGQKENEIEWLMKNTFSGVSFKTYIPCETSRKKSFLIAKDQGVSIGMEDGRAVFISWSNPELTDKRIQQFEKKCPRLQIKDQ